MRTFKFFLINHIKEMKMSTHGWLCCTIVRRFRKEEMLVQNKQALYVCLLCQQIIIPSFLFLIMFEGGVDWKSC